MKKRLIATLIVAACTMATTQTVFAQEEPAGAVSAIPERDAAFYDAQMQRYSAKITELISLMEGVKDEASANAAAGQARKICDELTEISEAVLKRCNDDEDVAIALEKKYPEALQLANKMDAIVDKLDRNDFYGSQELEAAFFVAVDEDDEEADDAPLTAAQEQFYGAAARELVATSTALKSLLTNVKDKESADAAAPEARKHVQQLAKVMDSLMDRDDYTPAVDAYLNENFSGSKGCMDDVMEMISELSAKGFYGSDALEDAMMLGD